MKNHTEELIRSMFAGDAEQVENHLNRLLEKYVSIRDFTTNAPKENYYHGFMNGLLINGCSLIREQKSNFESGNGYGKRNDHLNLCIWHLFLQKTQFCCSAKTKVKSSQDTMIN